MSTIPVISATSPTVSASTSHSVTDDGHAGTTDFASLLDTQQHITSANGQPASSDTQDAIPNLASPDNPLETTNDPSTLPAALLSLMLGTQMINPLPPTNHTVDTAQDIASLGLGGTQHTLSDNSMPILLETTFESDDSTLALTERLSTSSENTPIIPVTDVDSHPALTPVPVNERVAKTDTASQYPISPKLHEAGWQAAVNQRLLWLANQQIQSAQLTLNPENLGPIQVRIDVDAQQLTHVQFFAAHAEVRQALQESLPALSALFAQAGIQLGQSQVGSESGQTRFAPSHTFQNQGSDDEESKPLMIPGPSMARGQGLINTFA